LGQQVVLGISENYTGTITTYISTTFSDTKLMTIFLEKKKKDRHMWNGPRWKIVS
jgi:hypothetical protein